jgi:oligopeptide transport system substrate-binding protein
MNRPILKMLLRLMSASVVTLIGVTSVLATPARQVPPPTTLHIAMPAPGSLDPTRVSRFDPHARDLVENLFVGLTRFDPTTQTIKPMLARDWSVSEDGLTWTFELRDDISWVRFNPQTQQTEAVRPVAAGDFVYAIQRACDPQRPSPVTANLMIVQGCQRVANAFPQTINDLFIAREIGVRATGPHSLEIDLLFPASYFPTLLSTPEYRPLPRESVSDTADWTAVDILMTNGPFVLQAQSPGGLQLAQNPFWPDVLEGNIEHISVTFTSNTLSITELIATDAVDMARLASEDIASVRSTRAEGLHSVEASTVTLLGFSHELSLTNSKPVRQALSMAIDRTALASRLFPDEAIGFSQLTPPSTVSAPPINNVPFSPAQAQARFEEAGFAACSNMPEKLIVMVPNDDPRWAELGQIIIQQWTQVLGCNPALFELRVLSRPLLIELGHSAYDPEEIERGHVWLAFWSGDYPDANAWLSDALHCQYGYIRTGRACDEADTWLDQAAIEPDPVLRTALYDQVADRFFGPDGTIPVAPLFVSVSHWFEQPWLSGVNAYGSARFDLWSIDAESQPAR